ncbi:MAG TPA: sigma 54-interacting transcriptional regulator, partial [Burkholderiaceae bacterium]|nr:sigma 54-interacting transcriptional regulator [Burkholderiaceae bacterium]
GGTLFLDEVAELPLSMQVKLLRALQERRVRKVGATQETPVDVRLLCATHQDLPRMVAAGRFRQDLFYRIHVIELRVPSLRERGQDIVLIAQAILARAQAQGAPAVQLSVAACEALNHYAFPGNVRELENILERAIALAGGGELMPEDLMLVGAPSAPASIVADAAQRVQAVQDGDVNQVRTMKVPQEGAQDASAYVWHDGVPSPLGAYLDALESEAIRAALGRTNQNRTAAAQLLGITFRQLRYRMQRLGLK